MEDLQHFIHSCSVFTRLLVICQDFDNNIAFINLETLEEMNIRGRETFLEAGGKSFNYIPCLNDEESWVDFLVAASEK